MNLLDDWIEPHSMRGAFIEAMIKHRDRKGNPPETIDCTDLEVGLEFPKMRPKNDG